MTSARQETQRSSDSAPAGRVPPADNRPGAAQGPRPAKMPPRRTWLWFVLVLLANFLLVRLLMPSPAAPLTVPYPLFKQEVRKGNVTAIFSRGETIKGRFAAPVTYPPAGEQRTAPRNFAGLEGTPVYERFASGEWQYRHLVMRKRVHAELG